MSPFLISFFLIVAEQPQTVTVEDFLRKECAAGKQESCASADHLSSDLVIQKRLEKRSVEFWQEVNTQELMLDTKKPDLAAAYPLVMQDYIRMETEAGDAQTLAEDRLPECARHYHNHWINKKMWWPANDDGSPDWPSIYTFIVDHYYGYCLKQP
ncbi:MAG: hypothetical protein ACRESK_02495 [Gammaproteobacteria bacterium]